MIATVRTIRLTCTRRGHREWTVHTVRLTGDGVLGWTAEQLLWHAFGVTKGSMWAPAACEKCGLSPEIGRAAGRELAEIVRVAFADGALRVKVDVSKLPALGG